MLLTGVQTTFPDAVATIGIPLAAIAGVIFALFLWKRVSEIRVGGGSALRSENGREYLLEEEQRGESEVRGRLRDGGAAPCGGPHPALVISPRRGTDSNCRRRPLCPADRGEVCGSPGRNQRRSQQLPGHRVQIRFRVHGEFMTVQAWLPRGAASRGLPAPCLMRSCRSSPLFSSPLLTCLPPPIPIPAACVLRDCLRAPQFRGRLQHHVGGGR